jgi:hypothetical protein
MTAPPALTHAFTAYVDIGAPLELGPVGAGRRRIIPIVGGSVAGPRLSGRILSGGADWQIIRANDTAEVVARYTIQADDGALISVVNTGIRRGPPAVLARLAAGEAVDPALYYFRTTPVFEVAPGPNAWLTETIFIATGERHAKQVVIAVFAIS